MKYIPTWVLRNLAGCEFKSRFTRTSTSSLGFTCVYLCRTLRDSQTGELLTLKAVTVSISELLDPALLLVPGSRWSCEERDSRQDMIPPRQAPLSAPQICSSFQLKLTVHLLLFLLLFKDWKLLQTASSHSVPHGSSGVSLEAVGVSVSFWCDADNTSVRRLSLLICGLMISFKLDAVAMWTKSLYICRKCRAVTLHRVRLWNNFMFVQMLWFRSSVVLYHV